jgi:hypothetical protein
VTGPSLPAEERDPRLIGRVVIQGLVFTWACESGATLKVQHPRYGVRVVPLDRHYEPEILAKLTALAMLAKATAGSVTLSE